RRIPATYYLRRENILAARYCQSFAGFQRPIRDLYEMRFQSSTFNRVSVRILSSSDMLIASVPLPFCATRNSSDVLTVITPPASSISFRSAALTITRHSSSDHWRRLERLVKLLLASELFIGSFPHELI